MRRLLILLAASLLAACGHRSASTDNYDRTLYAPRYASGFEIVGADGAASTMLKVRNPWQGAEGIETRLFIARNGELAPAGFEGQVLDGDARRVVCMSSTHVAMLDLAGAAETIVGVSGLDYLSNAHVAANRSRIDDVGYEGNVDYERIVARQPDLVLLYGVNGASGMEAKLRELEIPFVYIGEYLEEEPLGKAEWLVAVAETVGRRPEAEEIFAAIPERYDALKRRVAAETSDTPSVMLNTPYGDSWFMPSAGSYLIRLICDAGGRYLYSQNDTGRSLPIDLEEAALLVSGADLWLHAQAASLDELRSRYPKFADAPCVREGRVWNCDRRTNAAGGNDFWESSVVHPDLVLRDLVKILHPELVDEPFVYYRRIK